MSKSLGELLGIGKTPDRTIKLELTEFEVSEVLLALNHWKAYNLPKYVHHTEAVEFKIMTQADTQLIEGAHRAARNR